MQMTADDLACESIFGKKTKQELIDSAIAKAKKKCDTETKKALFKSVDKKYEKGVISEKDYKKERKRAINLLHKTMIEFNININNFIDNKDQPTHEEIAQFADIIKQIKKAI